MLRLKVIAQQWQSDPQSRWLLLVIAIRSPKPQFYFRLLQQNPPGTLIRG
jgi:hypothetical protein